MSKTETQPIQTDNFDILLNLRSYGWSDFYLFVNEKSFEFTISHVFTDPCFDLINTLSDLIIGNSETSFVLQGEPDGVFFEIKKILTQQHKIIISIYNFDGFYNSDSKFNLIIEVEVKTKQFITILYLQLKKIFMLLHDKKFADQREGEWLLQNFHSFEKEIISFLKK
ncbi:hypothetical protein [Chryseobacterium sp. SIMBA_038]|uniref:hypothetical protein n=1 Tax=Chryseobacterium sp. SIMBA_038 TaxID=3085780 RepID=UPI00397B88E6